MARPLQIEVDSKELQREFKRLNRGLREDVVQQSVNRATSHVKTVANRLVRDRLTLLARDVNRSLTVQRAYRRTAVASLTVTARVVPMLLYKAKQAGRRKPVTVQISKGGRRKELEFAFIEAMDSGHRGVFGVDKSKKERRGPPPHRSQLPIAEMWGPQVIQVIEHADVMRELLRRGEARLLKVLRQRFDQLAR
jgi:hypothetical protein